MRSSSCIVLTTHLDDQVRVFWGQRSPARPFLGGYHAMVGGRQEEADVRWGGDSSRAALGCAARELFEECGVLCLIQGVCWTGAGAKGPVDAQTLEQARADSAQDPEAFYAFLHAYDLCLDEARYTPIGHWVSPPWYASRFATDFVHVDIPPRDFEALGLASLGAYVVGEEMIAGQWVDPAQAYEAMMQGEIAVSAPNAALMRAFARGPRPTQEHPLNQGDCPEPTQAIQARGALRVPLKSPTLAPATHTNCYVLDGGESFVVVDPGSAQRAELERLFEVVDQRVDEGLRFEAVVLTHHHVDHVVGVRAVCKRYGVPVWAHEATTPYVPELEIARHLGDGKRLELGPRRTLECVWTPGHAPGHLVLVDHAMGWAWIGDMMASVGTILINPPAGNMGDYMRSLERLLQLPVDKMLPAHGNIITHAHERVRAYIAHRQARERKILEAVGAHPAKGADVLVRAAYDDVPPNVWPVAMLSMRAHLEHLVEQGAIEPAGKGHRVVV